MSNRSKAIRVGLPLLLASACVDRAIAELDVTAGLDIAPKRPSIVATHTSDAKSADRRERDGYQIRCWQYGHLLFEENHVELAPAVTDGAVALQAPSGTRPAMYLIDTRNGNGLCLVRPSEPAAAKGTPGDDR